MPLPWWIEILNLSREWHRPPWEIVYDKGPVLWILRKREVDKLVKITEKELQFHEQSKIRAKR